MKLSDYLTREQLSDADFAVRVNCDRSTIYRVRKGQTKPSPQLMEAVARETGGLVQPNDYFDGLPVAVAA